MRELASGGGARRDALRRLSLRLFLVFLALAWASGILLHGRKLGFTPSSVRSYYLGSEEEFRAPASALGMLETTHAHLFAFGMSLLVLNHLMLLTALPERAKRALLVVSCGAALVSITSGWLVRFVSPAFAWLKLGSLALFHLSFLALLLVCFFGYRDGGGGA